MKALKQIFDFYINSSIHVALAVVSLSWLTLFEFQALGNKTILYFIFFASITGYNFVKYFGLAKFHHRSLANWLKIIQIFSLISFVLMCYYAFQIQIKTFIYLAILGLITFLYAIPFLPKHFLYDEKQNLRSVGGIKIYVIAFVWSSVTVFIPLVNNGVHISNEVFITALQRFIFVIVLTLPFEIRDLKFDSLKLATIPQKIGERWTKIIGVMLLLVFYALEYLKPEVLLKEQIVLLIIAVITLFSLIKANRDQGNYYSGFWVEGIPILWLLLTLFS